MHKNLSYCGELVRKHDPDRFFLSLFAPADRLEALWTLFAFNHEIAKTREVVSEPMLGQIRLQWWRDALAGIYDETRVLEHEVVQPLAEIIQNHDLPRDALEALIDAREHDLAETRFGDEETILRYAEDTSYPLLKLALRICGAEEEGDVTRAVGRNYALIGLLRSIPYNDIQNPELIKKAVSDHFQDDVAPKSRFLKKTQKFSSIYLKKMRKIDFDPASPRFYTPPHMLALRMML